MALPNITDARELDAAELSAAILEAKQQLFQLRFQQATNNPVSPHEFKHIRRRLAQLLTVETEQLAQSSSSQEV